MLIILLLMPPIKHPAISKATKLAKTIWPTWGLGYTLRIHGHEQFLGGLNRGNELCYIKTSSYGVAAYFSQYANYV